MAFEPTNPCQDCRFKDDCGYRFRHASIQRGWSDLLSIRPETLTSLRPFYFEPTCTDIRIAPVAVVQAGTIISSRVLSFLDLHFDRRLIVSVRVDQVENVGRSLKPLNTVFCRPVRFRGRQLAQQAQNEVM